MSQWKPLIFVIAMLVLGSCSSQSLRLEPDWIVDQANVLDAQQENAFINELSGFYDSTSVPMVGVTLNGVSNQTVESFAMSLYESWELGDPQTHNGIMILLLTEDRRVHIEVGSGIAGDILSVQALDSIEISMAVFFANEEYRQGFQTGFDLLKHRVSAVPWDITYTSLSDVEKDSLDSIYQIVLSEGVITGFEDDLIVVTDVNEISARLIAPADAPILSIDDVIGFSGRIIEINPVLIRVLNLEVDFAF
ncbi:MAG: TPM domain-containing protein [Bacteroidetes bacterium]|nr:TPM domain-containing protein [Bacteroidota bacterium]